MKKLPELDGNLLLRVSSTGTGASFALASMFVLFHEKLSFPNDWLFRIDLVLAFCVVIFSVRMVIESIKCMESLKKYPEDHLQEYLKEYSGTGSLSTFKKAVVLVLVVIVFCFAVILLKFTSPPLISAAVISFIIIAAEVEFFLAAIKSRRK